MSKINNKEVLTSGCKRALKIKDKVISKALMNIAKDAVSVAVDSHNFDNQTFNLEESYGYAVFHNGIMIDQMVEGASEGSQKAIDFLVSYTSTKSWELVVVAGADYAANLQGYIRKSDGLRSVAGDELDVLNKSFTFVALESLSYINEH